MSQFSSSTLSPTSVNERTTCANKQGASLDTNTSRKETRFIQLMYCAFDFKFSAPTTCVHAKSNPAAGWYTHTHTHTHTHTQTHTHARTHTHIQDRYSRCALPLPAHLSSWLSCSLILAAFLISLVATMRSCMARVRWISWFSRLFSVSPSD